MKNVFRKVASVLCIFFVSSIGLTACLSEEKSSSISEFNTTSYSYKENMDIAMKNAKSPKLLAKIDGIEITQVDLDLYSIDGETYTTEDIIKYYIITDYAEKIGLSLQIWDEELYNNIDNDDGNNEGVDEEYCQKAYGVSKDKVTEYRRKRIYQLGMNYSFSKMIIDDVASGEFVKRHPELNKAYEDFETQRYTNKKAWDNLEDAYYEFIAKNYEIVIY